MLKSFKYRLYPNKEQEIFEEIVSLLHCYSMKLYSKRKIQKIKEVLSDDERNDNSDKS